MLAAQGQVTGPRTVCYLEMHRQLHTPGIVNVLRAISSWPPMGMDECREPARGSAVREVDVDVDVDVRAGGFSVELGEGEVSRRLEKKAQRLRRGSSDGQQTYLRRGQARCSLGASGASGQDMAVPSVVEEEQVGRWLGRRSWSWSWAEVGWLWRAGSQASKQAAAAGQARWVKVKVKSNPVARNAALRYATLWYA